MTEEQQASCTGKVGHETKKDAMRVLRNTHLGEVYKCRFCNYWHIGHTKKLEKDRRPEWKPKFKKRGKR